MYRVKMIDENVFWIGSSDRRLALFENVFPIPRGVSYNSYLVLDDKTVLFDTVDKSVSCIFYENIDFLLKGRKLDYVVINHTEPDHCANLYRLIEKYPQIKIIGNPKTITFLKQFFDFSEQNYDIDKNFITVKDGDTFESGKHKFAFVMAPMVHWPEVMVTYDTKSKILFSADAFGTFGAFSGNIFADEINFECEWLDDARRYYSNIVGKYGAQVIALLNKAASLDISKICPLHGPIWRENLGWYIDKYKKWSAYEPEEKAVLIIYGSAYGNTENASDILASALSDEGVKNIKVYDVSGNHPSYLIAEAFRCSHLVFACPTYNAGLFCSMASLLADMKAHNLQKRTVALIENGSWAPNAACQMKEILSSLKDIKFLETTVSIKSSIKDEQRLQLLKLAKDIAEDLKK